MSDIVFEKRGEIAFIRINRPDALNTFTKPMFDDLANAKQQFLDDPALKVGVISGEGRRAFSAGIDLKAWSADLESGGSRKIPHPLQVEMATGSEFCEKPLIAAIRGYCIGEGMHLALACDFRVCASDAVFALPEVGLGIVQTWLSWQTVRTMGLPAAMELCLLAEKKDAAWALSRQLVHEVTLPGDEVAAAERIAKRLCEVNFAAVVASKKTLYKSADLNYRELLDYAMPLRAAVLDTGADRTQTHAFVNKHRG